MKKSCVLFSFSILFVGCFTETSVTKDEMMSDNSKVIFYLKDSSYITSYSNHHSREVGCYRVIGTIVRHGGFPKNFDGVVQDDELEKYGVDKFNVAGTLIAVGLAAAVISYIGHGIGQSFRMQ
jgi:hypothetical protein